MALFSKLKQIRELRQQAKSIQSVLAQESVEGSAAWGKVKVKMTGNQEVQTVEIDAELLRPDKKSDLEQAVQQAVNESIKKAQRVMAQKVRERGGLNLPGLK